jgi:hypothetical protein
LPAFFAAQDDDREHLDDFPFGQQSVDAGGRLVGKADDQILRARTEARHLDRSRLGKENRFRWP